MVKGGARILGRGRPTGGGTLLLAEREFAFAVPPFPFFEESFRNGPERSRAR